MLTWACIAPHGGDLIPQIAGDDLDTMAVTRAAMDRMGSECQAVAPDTIVVFTPHGICVESHICISVAEEAAGFLAGPGGETVYASFPLDQDLANAASDAASECHVPVVQAGYTADGNAMAVFPLDWGAFVPLWFLGARWKKPPSVVVICPARDLTRRQLVAFGRATVRAARATGRRIAIACSADQGHGHHQDGPYGFAPGSARYDHAYCRAIADGALGRLLHWRGDWVEAALPDSYWQTLMLLGALREAPLQPELLSYEAPTYFGMACAAFRPTVGSSQENAKSRAVRY